MDHTRQAVADLQRTADQLREKPEWLRDLEARPPVHSTLSENMQVFFEREPLEKPRLSSLFHPDDFLRKR